MKRLFLFVVLNALFSFTNAQYFQTGQDPASLKWRQINTLNFQIIYPDYYENQAQKLASVMEKVYLLGGKTLNYSPKKISIILHTQTVKSNGLVAWAPKRAEFYTIPDQRIYAQDWIEQLAIHEFRHVVQIDKINSELPNIIKILLGEQGTALVFGAYVPWWFIEGDAVVSETAFSNSGRGRVPSFLMENKALAVEKGIYKYDKAYNDSYKDFVPDHYKLGYYLVGQSREKYGTELWNSVLNRVGTKPFSLNPFNKALKETTGMNKVQLYNSVFEDLKKEWTEDDKKYQPADFKIVSPDKKTYTNYTYNYLLDDSTLISYKTALNEVASFVKINSKGEEKKIIVPGIIFDESVNYRDEWLVWSEQIPDARWQHSGKSFIRVQNIENGLKKTVYPEFTAFSPSISPDKKSVLTVESDFSSNYYLSVYNIIDGKLLHRYQTGKNNYFFSPEWLNEKEVVAVVLYPEGKRLVKIDLENKRLEIILNKDFGEIKNLRVQNDKVYFVGSIMGKNNLYRLSLMDNSVVQIYEARFGIESPAISPNGKNLVLSDYTSDGFRLIKIDAETAKEIGSDHFEKKNYKLADELAKQESGIIDFSKSDTAGYESKKYNKINHLFDFHSWAPAAVDVNTYEISPGVSILSQNKLGTAFLNLGYEWNITEKTGNFYGKFTFKGWYPVYDFEINSGSSASEYATTEHITDGNGVVTGLDTIIKRFTWVNNNINADIRVPLDFSQGQFTRFFQPEIKYDLTYYKHNSTTPDKFYEGSFQSLTYRLYYQQLLRKSMQDVYPNFGAVLEGMYRHSPFGEMDLGSLKLLQGYLFLPGILASHGIRIYGGAQDKMYDGTIGFSEVIRYPRGWGKINTNQMVSFATDYKFPVFYPEWSLGGLVYLQRVNASIFADYGRLNANIYHNGEVTGTFNSTITSYGIELTGNANFLRFYAPVEIGVRASYLPEKQDVYFNFLFSIDFNSL